jgi:hypothetical protein
MECPICTYNFDNKKRQPLICKCGNSICEECVTLISTRSNGAFLCPLCKYTIKDYFNNKLPYNKPISQLVIELDSINNPFKEASALTDPLILQNVETQYTEPYKANEFNEFITVLGLLILFGAIFPWVFYI